MISPPFFGKINHRKHRENLVFVRTKGQTKTQTKTFITAEVAEKHRENLLFCEKQNQKPRPNPCTAEVAESRRERQKGIMG